MRPVTNLMPRTAAVLGCAAVLCTAACAETTEPATPTDPPAFEGAIGLNLGWRPEYSGSGTQALKATPGFFLRWGRFTLTNASGFVTRRADDVVRGLGLDLVNDQRLRLNLALRYDAGRSESSGDGLAGTGDIKPTVRLRASATYRLEGPWRLGASWSVDAFGRGGGNSGDLSVGWEHAWSGHTTLGAGLSLGLAGDRYMQTYYGISEAQSQRSGYPVYKPGNGLRDLSLSLSGRTRLGDRWILLGGAGVSRLLGPAADSPLTRRTTGYSVSTGVAWRF
jgi:outer membrane scaffolding protein for murein synthesis (MipA/OmpV family)